MLNVTLLKLELDILNDGNLGELRSPTRKAILSCLTD